MWEARSPWHIRSLVQSCFLLAGLVGVDTAAAQGHAPGQGATTIEIPAPTHADLQRASAALSGHERAVGRKILDQIGNHPDRILVAVSKSARLPRHIRLRALRALGWCPTEHSFTHLTKVISDTSSSPASLRRAAQALTAGFAERSLSHLGPLLRHPLPRVRQAAAHALLSTRSSAAEKMLADWLRHETSRELVRSFRRKQGKR